LVYDLAPLYEKGENYSLIDVNDWMHSKLQKIIGRKMSNVEEWLTMNEEDEFGFEPFGGISPLDGKKKKKSIRAMSYNLNKFLII